MATIIPIGTPVNDAERAAIAHLRDNAPITWIVLHNFELEANGEWFEIDLAVLTPHAVWLVDVKGTQGLIEVDRGKWHPEGRSPFASPLPKLRNHARTFKGLLTGNNRGRPELEGIYVGVAIILTAPDARLVDREDRDSGDVTTLARCLKFFGDPNRVPSRFAKNINPHLGIVRSLITGKGRKRSGPIRFGHWEVTERLGSVDGCTEYRARNAFTGERGGSVLLRVYQADPYLPEEERAAQRARIANAYHALSQLPPHPRIAGARDFFPDDDGMRFVLVTDDPAGQALRLHITRPTLALTQDQKLAVAEGLLEALAHTGVHEVTHRAVSPATILVGRDGSVSLTGFDYARTSGERSHTVAGELAEAVDEEYMAPECLLRPETANPASDIFSAGVVLYELFLVERPYADAGELHSRKGVFPERPPERVRELPDGLYEWLQILCRYEPRQRPDAASALASLKEIKGTPSQVPRQPDETPDYRSLPREYALTRKYVVQERLGRPGTFGVTYRVFDTLGDTIRALKLILYDRYSTVERL